MDLSALFKITYGLFVVGVEYEGKLNGCVINTASQATAEPPKMVVTMQKSNYTAELINKKGSFSISVLNKDCPLETIKNFGFNSGRDVEKFKLINYKEDSLKNPYLVDSVNAVVELVVEDKIDLDTHWLYICSIKDAKTINDKESMTYDDYRAVKSGKQISAKENKKEEKKYICTICHYVYDGDIPFEELPDDYLCPICKQGKDKFVQE